MAERRDIGQRLVNTGQRAGSQPDPGQVLREVLVPGEQEDLETRVGRLDFKVTNLTEPPDCVVRPLEPADQRPQSFVGGVIRQHVVIGLTNLKTLAADRKKPRRRLPVR